MTDLVTLEKLGFTETYQLYLTGTKSEKTFSLEDPIKNVISVEVHSALIPRTEYTIQDDNEEFHFTFATNPQDGDWIRVHLDNRDYDITDFINELNDKLQDGGKSITVSEIDGKSKLRFTSNVPFSIDKMNTTCQKALGFNYSETIDSPTKIGDEWILDADNRYNLMGTEVVLCESDIDNQLNHAKNNSISAPLAVFYVTDSSKSQFTQEIHGVEARPFFPIASLSKITLKFKRGHKEPGSDVNHLYDFHGVQWYMQLVIKCGSFGKDWSTIGTNKGVLDTQYILEQLIHYIKESTEPKKEKKKKIEGAPLTWKQKATLAAVLGGGAYVGYKYCLPKPQPISPFL